MNGKKVRGGYTVWTPGQDPGVFVSSFFNRYLSLSCLQLVLTGISRRQKHPSQKSKLQMSPLIFYHSLNRKATSGIDVAWIIVFSQLKSRKQRFIWFINLFMWKKKNICRRIIFCDTWKLCRVQISVSIKMELECSHAHLFPIGWFRCITTEWSSSYGKGTAPKPKIFTPWPLQESLPASRLEVGYLVTAYFNCTCVHTETQIAQKRFCWEKRSSNYLAAESFSILKNTEDLRELLLNVGCIYWYLPYLKLSLWSTEKLINSLKITQ